MTPVHAVLNYCFALLQAETRLCLSALGLDPGLGIGLHTDTANRDSLALDVLEPIRPEVETWLLNWISSEPLRRSDFFETGTGNCRLVSGLCKKLSDTCSVWRKLATPWAEHVARELWSSTPGKRTRALAIRSNKREVKGSVQEAKQTRPEHVCRGCGKKIRIGRSHCGQCAVENATQRLTDAAAIGRLVSHTPEARAKQSATRRRHARACSEWDPSTQPAWLTEDVYRHKVVPLLSALSTSKIAAAIGVSRGYAGRIREGYRPHPRHWRALAKLVGTSDDRLIGQAPGLSN